MTLVGLGRSLCASSAGPAKQAWTCRSHADLSASVSRAYPTEPRVGVGVVVLRELSPGNPETLLIRRAKAPNKGEWVAWLHEPLWHCCGGSDMQMRGPQLSASCGRATGALSCTPGPPPCPFLPQGTGVSLEAASSWGRRWCSAQCGRRWRRLG